MASPRPLLTSLLHHLVFKPHPFPLYLRLTFSTPSLHSRNPRPYPTPLHRNRYSSSRPEPEPEPKPYTFEEIRALSTNPSPRRIIIDVREPSELHESGRIPGAYNMPLTSNPDAFYLSEDEFFGRFGFERPRVVAAGDGQGDAGRRVPTTAESPFSPKQKEREAQAGLNSEEQGGSLGGHDEVGGGGEKVEADGRSGVEEVVFYCKAGIRSRAAARMAREWKGVKVGDMKGGWMEWEGKGGSVQR